MRTRVNVGMYIPSFLPFRGGLQIATCDLAAALKEICRVKVFTFNWIPTPEERKYGMNLSAGLPEFEVLNGVPVYRYPITNLPVVKSVSYKLMKELYFSDINILHCQGVLRLFSMNLLQRVAKNKIKILTTHGLHESIRIVKEKSPFVHTLFVKTLCRMDHIVALTRSDLLQLLRLGIPRSKISVIPNGIDVQKFKRRTSFVEKNAKLKILTVARFDKNKRYEDLVCALGKLKKSIDFQAYFVGAITDRQYFLSILSLIKNMGLEKSIRIGASIRDSDLVDCYLSSGIFVLPSSEETSPLVILEAMYAGLPVIASKVGGIPDLVKNGENGLLVPPNDPQQLYNACLQLLRNEKKRLEIGKKNRELAHKCTWDNVAQRTFELYQRMMDVNPSI